MATSDNQQAPVMKSDSNSNGHFSDELRPLRCIATDENTNDSMSGGKGTLRQRWLVIGSGFIFQLFSNGLIINLSVLFLKLQYEFEKPKAETAIVQSVATAAFQIGGIFAGFLTTRLGVVKTGTLGSTLCFVGFASSFFAPNIPYLVVSLGLIAGFGSSVMFSFSAALIGIFVDGKDKFIALSIIAVGGGVGAISFPFIIDTLSAEYGWRGALLILAALLSHSFIFILLSWIQIKTAHKDVTTDEQTIGTREIVSDIFRNKIFVTYSVVFCVSFGMTASTLILFVDMFINKGFDRSTAVFAYFTWSVTGLFTRPLPGLLKKVPHISIFSIKVLSSVLVAFVFGLFPFITSLTVHIIVTCLFGLSYGISVSLIPVAAVSLLGPKHFAVGLGMIMTLLGLLTVCGGPLIGFVKDYTGSYDLFFHIACALECIIIIFLVGIMISRWRYKERRAPKHVTTIPEGGDLEKSLPQKLHEIS